MVTRRGLLTTLTAGAAGTAGCLVSAPETVGCGEEVTSVLDTDAPIEDRLGSEREYRLDRDRSGDGIPDLVLAANGFDPARKHAFVRVDLAVDVACHEQFDYARSVFADAPVDNPDGSTGIDVHFTVRDRTDETIPEEADVSNFSKAQRYHWKTEWTDGFDRRDRGHRHLVIEETVPFGGWYGNYLLLTIERGLNSRLVDLLAAEFAGRFDPLIPDEEAGDPGLEPLWFPDETGVSPQRLLAEIDWEVVEANLSSTTPSTRWYEERYAHLAPERDVPDPLSEPPENRDEYHDTSGDGIPDSLLESAEIFEDASPLRKNVFVEVDYLEGVSRDRVDRQMSKVAEVFAEAPVRNPDGSMGIDFHYVVSDEIPETVVLTLDRATRQFRREYFDRDGMGFIYVVFGEDVHEVRGRYGRGGFIITQPNFSTVLHEIGHSIGLDPRHDGIDDFEFSFEEYPSVMNYNSDTVVEPFAFSSGDAHPDAPSDWDIVERRLDDHVPRPSRLLRRDEA